MSPPDTAAGDAAPQADLVLNLEGLVCPVPVVKVANAIKGLEIGGIVEATATDPGILADIPAWCRGTGNELLKMERNGGAFVFWVRRAK